MSRKIRRRLADILDAIEQIKALLDDKDFAALRTDRAVRAALERFLEIISEASRHVPEDWKSADAPDLEWRKIADIGNQLRHAYQRIDLEILWNVYQDDLGPLEAAIEMMLEKYFSDQTPS